MIYFPDLAQPAIKIYTISNGYFAVWSEYYVLDNGKGNRDGEIRRMQKAYVGADAMESLLQDLKELDAKDILVYAEEYNDDVAEYINDCED